MLFGIRADVPFRHRRKISVRSGREELGCDHGKAAGPVAPVVECDAQVSRDDRGAALATEGRLPARPLCRATTTLGVLTDDRTVSFFRKTDTRTFARGVTAGSHPKYRADCEPCVNIPISETSNKLFRLWRLEARCKIHLTNGITRTAVQSDLQSRFSESTRIVERTSSWLINPGHPT